MNEIYRTFEGLLNCQTRDGYIVYLCDDGNISVNYLNVMEDVNDQQITFKQTARYNKDSKWSPELCKDLFEDVFSGEVTKVNQPHNKI